MPRWAGRPMPLGMLVVNRLKRLTGDTVINMQSMRNLVNFGATTLPEQVISGDTVHDTGPFHEVAKESDEKRSGELSSSPVDGALQGVCLPA